MSKFAYDAIRIPYRMGVFVDSLNIFCACRDKWNRVISHGTLLRVALAGHRLYRAIVYGIRFSAKMSQWIKAVEHYGYEVKEKDPIYHVDGSVKANWDIDIVIDIWRMLAHIDVVVLASGDGDFCALVQRCQELGKIVRVIGVEDSTSARLIGLADEFVPITEDMLLERKAQQKQFGSSLGVALRRAGVTPESSEKG